MRKRKLILIPVSMLLFTVLATATSAAPAVASKAPLVIAMRDPGCHWFYLGGGPEHRKYATSVIRRGPVTLQNLDEAALIIKGPGGTKTQPVGALLTLKTKGVYHITMVRQARDDNHLTLKVT